MKVLPSLLMTLLVLSSSLASQYTYQVSDAIVGQGFYQLFDWETMEDPTNGRV